jgi:hypothetical protein
MKTICTKNHLAAGVRHGARSRIDQAISLPVPDGRREGIRIPTADRRPTTTTDSALAAIGTAICRSFLLWMHLGIGPMFGAGPMQTRIKRPTPRHGRGTCDCPSRLP